VILDDGRSEVIRVFGEIDVHVSDLFRDPARAGRFVFDVSFSVRRKINV
jgi:hypothetical protein